MHTESERASEKKADDFAMLNSLAARVHGQAFEIFCCNSLFRMRLCCLQNIAISYIRSFNAVKYSVILYEYKKYEYVRSSELPIAHIQPSVGCGHTEILSRFY